MVSKIDEILNKWSELKRLINNDTNQLSELQKDYYDNYAVKLSTEATREAKIYDNADRNKRNWEEYEESEDRTRKIAEFQAVLEEAEKKLDKYDDKLQEIRTEIYNYPYTQRYLKEALEVLINTLGLNGDIKDSIFEKSHDIAQHLRIIGERILTNQPLITPEQLQEIKDTFIREHLGYDDWNKLDEVLNGDTLKDYLEEKEKNTPTPTTEQEREEIKEKTKLDFIKETLGLENKQELETLLEGDKLKEYIEKLKDQIPTENIEEKIKNATNTFINDNLGYLNKEELKTILGDKNLKDYLKQNEEQKKQLEQDKEQIIKEKDERPNIKIDDYNQEKERLTKIEEKLGNKTLEEYIEEVKKEQPQISKPVIIDKPWTELTEAEKTTELQKHNDIIRKFFDYDLPFLITPMISKVSMGWINNVFFTDIDKFIEHNKKMLGQSIFLLDQNPNTKCWGLVYINVYNSLMYYTPTTLGFQQRNKELNAIFREKGLNEENGWKLPLTFSPVYQKKVLLDENDTNFIPAVGETLYSMNKDNDPTYSLMWCLAYIKHIIFEYLQYRKSFSNLHCIANDWIQNEKNWLQLEKKLIYDRP